MKHYKTADKIIYILLCLSGVFLISAITVGFYKFACIDFEIIVYDRIVLTTIYIAVLTAIPVITALIYIYLNDKKNEKLDFIETHYIRKHYDDYKECVELYEIDRGKW